VSPASCCWQAFWVSDSNAPLLRGTSLSGGGDFKVVVQTVKLGVNYRF
jgi:hypothetical protein